MPITHQRAPLTGAEDGLVFCSGMAAITATALSLLQQGDHAVFSCEVYGMTDIRIINICGKSITTIAARLN
jgi:cystathionine beta-lyase/cystathionine gamma-synthase